jgi:hypothetical protein
LICILTWIWIKARCKGNLSGAEFAFFAEAFAESRMQNADIRVLAAATLWVKEILHFATAGKSMIRTYGFFLK